MTDFTSFENVWQANVEGTDDLVQSDGVWPPTFASEASLPPESVILREDYVSDSDSAAVTNTRAINPMSPYGYQGENIDPDTTPGTWVDMKTAWATATENPLIEQQGMWPPPNIGVSRIPVRWFGLTDGRAFDDPDETNGVLFRRYQARLVRSSQVIQLGSQVFSGRGEAETIGPIQVTGGHLFVFRHIGIQRDTHKGLIFLHLDTDDLLTFGVLGETYYPDGSIDPWDMFHGPFRDFVLTVTDEDDEGNPVERPFEANIGADTISPLEVIFGATADRSLFRVLPVRADVIRDRAFPTGRILRRRAAGVYWRVQVAPTGGTGETATYQTYVDIMKDKSVKLLNIILRWLVVGAPGRNVLP